MKRKLNLRNGLVIFTFLFVISSLLLYKRVKRTKQTNTKKGAIIPLDQALDQVEKIKKYMLKWCPHHKKRHKLPKDCGRCVVTFNRSLITHPDTGAVIYDNKCMRRNQMPPDMFRRPDMLYIWNNEESPSYTKVLRFMNLTEFESGYFNATITYRRDSTFVKPYRGAFFLRRNIKRYEAIYSIKPNRMAVWIVSNCGKTPGAIKRMNLFKKLQRAGLQIEAFGRCFRRRINFARGTPSFYKFVRQYKFYLAFENSYHCRDYITEKFFEHGLLAGTIPVVWGAKKQDYEAIAPTKSFIHVDDFSSITKLVRYLNYLAKNETEYKTYFEWKVRLLRTKPDDSENNSMCKLCRSLHLIETLDKSTSNVFQPPKLNKSKSLVKLRVKPKRRVIHSIDNWWYNRENAECYS